MSDAMSDDSDFNAPPLQKKKKKQQAKSPQGHGGPVATALALSSADNSPRKVVTAKKGKKKFLGLF